MKSECIGNFHDTWHALEKIFVQPNLVYFDHEGIGNSFIPPDVIELLGHGLPKIVFLQVVT